MKLAEFKDLCDREWGEARGDVRALHLTDESLLELSRDVIADGTYSVDPFGVHPARTGCGVTVSKVVNPATRSAVKVTGGAGMDTAEVRRHYAKALTVTGDAEIPRGRLAGEIKFPIP